jgi:hypothetical protein
MVILEEVAIWSSREAHSRAIAHSVQHVRTATRGAREQIVHLISHLYREDSACAILLAFLSSRIRAID